MTSKDYLKQIAESKGVCPLTNEVKDNALLFPIGFEYIFQDLDRLERLEKENQELKEDFLKPIGFMCRTRESGMLQRQELIYLANKYNLPITIMDCETNKKYKKLENALEIIKNKKTNLFHIWVFDDYEQYKEHYPFSEYNAREDMLTFEEFNFLKEILENE